MDLGTTLFYVLALLTGVSAVGVVVTQNIVRAAAFLLFALAGVAGIFFHLGADFVGATQLLVYVGGTLVLVVFGVMLTAQGPFINLRISAVEWALAAGVALVLFGVLAIAVAPGWRTTAPQPPAVAAGDENPASSIVLGEALLGVEKATPWARRRTTQDGPLRADLPAEAQQLTQVTTTNTPAATARGRTRMVYVLPFEIVSVHLLVVLIGAAYLARAKRRRVAPEQLP